MKMYEHEAYLNPFQAAMFAGEIDWQTPRQQVDVLVQGFSDESIGSGRLDTEHSLEREAVVEDAASSLLSAISNYFQRGVAGLGNRNRNRDYDRHRYPQVIEGLRRLNRELADEVVAENIYRGSELSAFENTAFCAVTFASAVNIAIPLDCADLQRWYKAVCERSSV